MNVKSVPAARKARWIALGFGLPYGWQVRQRGRVIVAWGEQLPCGHRSISATISDDGNDMLWAASRLAAAIRLHMVDGI